MKQGIEILLLATGIFKRKARNESLVRWQLHVSFCFLSRPPGNAVPAKETNVYFLQEYMVGNLNKHFLKTNNLRLFYYIFTNSNRLIILLRLIFHLHFHHIHCYRCCYCCSFQYLTIIYSFPFFIPSSSKYCFFSLPTCSPTLNHVSFSLSLNLFFQKC